MRTTQFMEGEYYLLSGQGVGGSDLFLEEADYARFIFLVLYFQSPTLIQNVSFYTSAYMRKRHFPLGEPKLHKILKTRQVEPVAFVFCPKSYHLLLRNKERHSVSAYMQRILMGYGKYYNSKYEKSGHVFDGPYRCRHIKNNRELLAATAHLHRKPTEMPNTAFTYEEYPYSTCQDYLGQNRWGELLDTTVVLSQFKNGQDFARFLRTSVHEDTNLLLDF